MASKYIPQDCWIYYAGDDGEVSNENFYASSSVDIDVKQINLAVELSGEFTNRNLKLTLTDSSDPSRVFTSYNRAFQDYTPGTYVGFLSFYFDNFHMLSTENYIYKVEVNEASASAGNLLTDGVNVLNDGTNNLLDDSVAGSDTMKFGLIADWFPYTNDDVNTQIVQPPRVELYGVDSGLLTRTN